jgi:hypothetical protein
MSWKIKITDQWADKCRFAVRAILFLNALILALASVWLTTKCCWFLIRFLNRTIFSAPW